MNNKNLIVFKIFIKKLGIIYPTFNSIKDFSKAIINIFEYSPFKQMKFDEVYDIILSLTFFPLPFRNQFNFMNHKEKEGNKSNQFISKSIDWLNKNK